MTWHKGKSDFIQNGGYPETCADADTMMMMTLMLTLSQVTLPTGTRDSFFKLVVIVIVVVVVFVFVIVVEDLCVLLCVSKLVDFQTCLVTMFCCCCFVCVVQ